MLNRKTYIKKWKSSPIGRKLSGIVHNEREKIQKREWQRHKNKELRNEVLLFLGNKCVKCGYSGLALQIDHINGGGTKERLQHTCSYAYYLAILKSITNGENRYQLLCANCNWEKRISNKEEKRLVEY